MKYVRSIVIVIVIGCRVGGEYILSREEPMNGSTRHSCN